jgi:hypothetical protein
MCFVDLQVDNELPAAQRHASALLITGSSSCRRRFHQQDVVTGAGPIFGDQADGNVGRVLVVDPGLRV